MSGVGPVRGIFGGGFWGGRIFFGGGMIESGRVFFFFGC